MILNCLFQTTIVLLPIVSIFVTGLKYPVKEQIIKPVFQPPDWAFSQRPVRVRCRILTDL